MHSSFFFNKNVKSECWNPETILNLTFTWLHTEASTLMCKKRPSTLTSKDKRVEKFPIFFRHIWRWASFGNSFYFLCFHTSFNLEEDGKKCLSVNVVSQFSEVGDSGLNLKFKNEWNSFYGFDMKHLLKSQLSLNNLKK